MEMVRCPQCRLPFTASEAAAGKCPECGFSLSQVIASYSGADGESVPLDRGTCLACRKPGEGFTCYMRLTSSSVLPPIVASDRLGDALANYVRDTYTTVSYYVTLTAHTRTMYARCYFCPFCRKRVLWIKILYAGMIAMIWALPVLGLGLGLFFTTQWEREDPAFRPGSTQAIMAVVVFYILPVVIWMTGSICMIYVRRYQLHKIFDPETRDRLNRLLGSHKWSSIHFGTFLPSGQQFTDLTRG